MTEEGVRGPRVVVGTDFSTRARAAVHHQRMHLRRHAEPVG
ncbi:hypothetical protein [Blastococcus sp. CT_GayMR16]|nr:hypothetical protein [Blastococcus sp. CT_GayMR16]